ncbi:hypothetical protein [Deinococcus marmoris]|uniref:hypothetical protein n=1 Tax=Deinococcus marmoris TaxID=249408 RepID=UPI00049773BB|nr:hypothetical protein [Deinococcus marmoris]
MKYRYLAVLVNNAGAVHTEDGVQVTNFPSIAAFAQALKAPPSTQPMLSIFNALGAVGWQLVGVDREPTGGLYIFSRQF